MVKISDLTVHQAEKLLNKCIKEPNKSSGLTDKEIKELAFTLQIEVNLPFIYEDDEDEIPINIITKVDEFLTKNLPDKFYDLIRSVDDGIDDKTSKRLIKQLSKLAKKHINLPYLPKSVENIAIRFIINSIINAAEKQNVLV